MVNTTKSNSGNRKNESVGVPDVDFNALKHLLIADLEMVEAEKRELDLSQRNKQRTSPKLNREAVGMDDREAAYLLKALHAQAEALRRENEVIRSLATVQQKQADLSVARAKEEDLLKMLVQLKSEVEAIKGQKKVASHQQNEAIAEVSPTADDEASVDGDAVAASVSGAVIGVLQNSVSRLKAVAAVGRGYFSKPEEQEATIDDARWGVDEIYYVEQSTARRNLWRGAAVALIVLAAVGSGYYLIQKPQKPTSLLSDFGVNDQPSLFAPLANGDHRLGAYADEGSGVVTVATSDYEIEEAPGSRTTEVPKSPQR